VIELRGKKVISIFLFILMGVAINGAFGASTLVKGTLSTAQTNAIISSQDTGGQSVQEQYPNYIASITVPQDGDDANLASLAKITADQAKDAAVAHLSANIGDVKTVSLENENGNLVYSVQILKQGIMYDVKIDAGNGIVLYTEQGIDDIQNGEDVSTMPEIED
jgi:uncharacterized membrane protein YkoI